MKTWHHLLCLVLVALGVGAAFLQEPGAGDDFTYWSHAFDLHERGQAALQRQSFHDLRWPVWGVCWAFQAAGIKGLPSYYGEPLLYLAAGAALAFAFGRRLTGSNRTAWASGIAFLFHPLLDTVCYRPMPDLSEGVWGATAVLSWWALMRSKTRALSCAFAALTGTCVFICESNRVTGAFIVPVLVLATVLWFRPRFGWLLLAGVVAAGLYGVESFIYRQLFSDWLHSIHANMGNTGNKGTAPIALWTLPFRFLDSLWSGGRLAPLYCLSALVGIGVACRPRTAAAERPVHEPEPLLGRVLVLWFGVLFLEYSCVVQPAWPLRPLLRDADRFLAGLAVPMSVLAAIGTLQVFGRLKARWRFARLIAARPLATGVVVIALLAVSSARDWLKPGFVPEMRRYVSGLTPGTRVFTHTPMKHLAFLVDPVGAQRVTWLIRNSILDRSPALEALAAEADQFWYVRKLVWLNTRKDLERQSIAEQKPLGSYFEAPERDWTMTRLLTKGDTPDLVFYRRRVATDLPPLIIPDAGPELRAFLPVLPMTWQGEGRQKKIRHELAFPAEWRGKFCRLEFRAASPQVEAVTLRLEFDSARKHAPELLLKPYLFPNTATEFFAFKIPDDATTCNVELAFSARTKRVTLDALRLVIQTPPAD